MKKKEENEEDYNSKVNRLLQELKGDYNKLKAIEFQQEVSKQLENTDDVVGLFGVLDMLGRKIEEKDENDDGVIDDSTGASVTQNDDEVDDDDFDIESIVKELESEFTDAEWDLINETKNELDDETPVENGSMKTLYAVPWVDIEYGWSYNEDGYKIFDDIAECIKLTKQDSYNANSDGAYYGPMRPLHYIKTTDEIEGPYPTHVDDLKRENNKTYI